MNSSFFNSLTDEAWLGKLIESIHTDTIDGVTFPRFPSEEIQAKFVGSSSESALKEGFEFYRLTKGYAHALGMPLNHGRRLLDFGCGWGRFLRFFWRDVGHKGLYGADIDPDIIKACKENNVPGELHQIYAGGKLPFPDEFFDCIVAYSVFTHLPEQVHHHWLSEIARVAKPGAVFLSTLESERFLNFIGNLSDGKLDSDWHKALAVFKPQITNLKEKLAKDGFVYLPTGGGSEYRTSDIYGESVVSLQYLEKNWNQYFKIREYIDDGRFWQAVAICQKP